jgi:uncharacterized membrane protein
MTLRKTFLLMFLLAIFGFADSFYLTLEHFLKRSVICLNGSGCDLVLQSSYSVVLGIPISAVGLVYYLSVAVLSFWAYKKNSELQRYFVARLPLVGFLASAWFVYLQAFVLRAYCTWCLFSALLSTIIFILGLRVWLHKPESS